MNALDTAVYSRLQTTSAITSLLAGTTAIFYQRAPEGQAYPYIVFSYPSELDMNETPRRRKNDLIFIRAYAQGGNGAAQAGSIDDQIDAALHLVPLTVSGWSNIWLAREQGLESVESVPTGQNVFMKGANYRAMLNP